jgi:hypothetical protein
MQRETQTSVALYRSKDGSVTLDVQLDPETVWLSQAQKCCLFERDPRGKGSAGAGASEGEGHQRGKASEGEGHQRGKASEGDTGVARTEGL